MFLVGPARGLATPQQFKCELCQKSKLADGGRVRNFQQHRVPVFHVNQLPGLLGGGRGR